MWKWSDLTRHWEDWPSMAIGACLIASPWALGFVDTVAATNAYFTGVSIFVVALLARVQFEAWEEWLLGAVGLWSIAAPWVVGFSDQSPALWTHVAAGGLIIILSAAELLGERFSHARPGSGYSA